MAARESEAMKKARALVMAGVTPYAAAKQTGLTKGAIYNAPWYKTHKSAKIEAPRPLTR